MYQNSYLIINYNYYYYYKLAEALNVLIKLFFIIGKQIN